MNDLDRFMCWVLAALLAVAALLVPAAIIVGVWLLLSYFGPLALSFIAAVMMWMLLVTPRIWRRL